MELKSPSTQSTSAPAGRAEATIPANTDVWLPTATSSTRDAHHSGVELPAALDVDVVLDRAGVTGSPAGETLGRASDAVSGGSPIVAALR